MRWYSGPSKVGPDTPALLSFPDSVLVMLTLGMIGSVASSSRHASEWKNLISNTSEKKQCNHQLLEVVELLRLIILPVLPVDLGQL